MLVLSRTVGEVIVIGDEITITIIEVRGNKVRVGINAPRDISVHRHEVWVQIQEARPKPAPLAPFVQASASSAAVA